MAFRYAVLRNYSLLPESTGGSDLDIWVCSEDANSLISALQEVSIKTNSCLVSYIDSETSPKFCFMSQTEGIQIDLFIGDIYSKYGMLFPQSIILDSINEYHGIFVIHDDLADIISFVKELVNNRECDYKYIKTLFEKRNNFSRDYLRKVLARFSIEFVDLIFQCIQKREITKAELMNLVALSKNNLHHESMIQKWRKSLRFFCSPGYVIAVIGTDGSGKSTIINAITPILEEAFHNGLFYHHLRPHWLRDLGVIMGKRNDCSEKIVVDNPHGEKPSGLIVSLCRWCFYLIDYSIGYLRIVWLSKRTKSHVHIFDRYYYDYYIDPYRLRVKLPHWIVRFGEIIVPSPDIVLCLGGDANLIYRRKPETSLDEVIRQNEILKTFCNKRKNAVWIDTTHAKESSIRDVMVAIQSMMAKRFAKVIIK